MKRTAILILCLVMIITCFTACKQDAKPTTPESKTDVSTPAIVDQQPKEEVQAEADVSEPAQKEEKEPVQQSDDEQEETEPVSKVESKPTSKVESKPASKVEISPVDKTQKTEQTVSDDQNSYEEIKDDVPVFKSDVEFQKWLKGETISFEDARKVVLNTAKENAVTYARPKISKDDNYRFNEILVEANQGFSTICYRYVPKVKNHSLSSVSIHAHSHDNASLRKSYEDAQKDANGEKEYYQYVRHGSIDYYLEYNSVLDSFVIYWEQFGFIHTAIADHVYEQIEQILPLLELEQVTVKLNDDAVIK